MGIPQQRFSAEDRRLQILDVARRIFARKGYEGTTTREIAAAAKVNEAIIFRHFPTKEELYWAVLDSTSRNTGGLPALQNRIAEGGSIRDVLTDVAEAILNRREKDQTLTRLLFFSALENHELSTRFFNSYVAGYYEVLVGYVREQIECGVLRSCDALMAARGFLGMVIYHSLIQNLFGGLKIPAMKNRDVANAIVCIWLDGMLPPKSRERRESQPGERTACGEVVVENAK